eukprot:m.10188 g.10188  ORF g.10188 m.10188 type:complete len:1476 (-) comp4217_c0_seq1:1475-5902(-)
MASFNSDHEEEFTDVAALSERKAQLAEIGFNLHRLLASGAFAEVYKVERRGKEFAAKVYYELSWEDRVAHAKKEFLVMKKFSHPNILEVYDFHLTGDIVFLTMELLTGGELLDHIRGGFGMRSDVGQRVLCNLADALGYLHGTLQVAHLDVKPENILLSDTGVAKLCDFDTVLPLGTRVRRMRGTLEYHAPEYFVRRMYHVVAPAGDIWALGLVAYELLLGDYAWDSPTDLDTRWRRFIAVECQTFEPWCKFSSGLLDFFQNVLNEDPLNRITIADFKDYVQKFWRAETDNMRKDLVPESSDGGDDEREEDYLQIQALLPGLNPTVHWVVHITPIDQNTHHKFQIVCIPPNELSKGGRLVCCERYSRLLALHRMCIAEYPSTTPTSFPKKKVIGRRKLEFVLQRAEGLEDYFEDAFEIKECRDFWHGQTEFEKVGSIDEFESSVDDSEDRDMVSDTSLLYEITPLDEKLFQKIPFYPMASLHKLCSEALKYPTKNRFPDVLPKWDTRVKLKLNPDYINANYITDKRYIVTQAPLASTVSDFWHMIWDEQVCFIIMLTEMIEGGMEKCVRYWPEAITPEPKEVYKKYGKIQVSFVSSKKKEGFWIQTFKTQHRGEYRYVQHIWSKSWPEYGVPVSPDGNAYPTDVLRMLHYVNNLKQKISKTLARAPIVVHCGGGVGRSGTVVAINEAISELEKNRKADVVDIITRIRRDRYNLVQRIAQYKFVWQAVVAFAKSLVDTDPLARIVSMKSSISQRQSAKLRRESVAQTGPWQICQSIQPGREMYTLRKDAKPVFIKPSENDKIESMKSLIPKFTIKERDLHKDVIVSGFACKGKIVFVGPHHEHRTPRIGVVLAEPLGNINGTVGGHKYFECDPNYGILCHPNKVSLMQDHEEPPIVGTYVIVRGYPNIGKVKYVGVPKQGQKGFELVGIQLDGPYGDTNGTLDGIEYFKCNPLHGIFVNPKKVKKLKHATKKDVGERVVVSGIKCLGTLRYYGKRDDGKMICGIELDEPLGKNDGTFREQKLFTCRPNHGIYVRRKRAFLLHEIKRIDSFAAGRDFDPMDPFMLPLRLEVPEGSAPRKYSYGESTLTLSSDSEDDEATTPETVPKLPRSPKTPKTPRTPRSSGQDMLSPQAAKRISAASEDDFDLLTPQESGPTFTDLISRHLGEREDHEVQHKTLQITLSRMEDESFGIALTTGTDGEKIVIKLLLDSVAAENLMVGDVIESIEGMNAKRLSQTDVLALLNQLDEVTLVCSRRVIEIPITISTKSSGYGISYKYTLTDEVIIVALDTDNPATEELQVLDKIKSINGTAVSELSPDDLAATLDADSLDLVIERAHQMDTLTNVEQSGQLVVRAARDIASDPHSPRFVRSHAQADEPSKCPWMWTTAHEGNCEEQVLKGPIGTFFIRPSERPQFLALVVNENGTTKKFAIENRGPAEFSFRGHVYKCLSELVQDIMTNRPIKTKTGKLNLVFPPSLT